MFKFQIQGKKNTHYSLVETINEAFKLSKETGKLQTILANEMPFYEINEKEGIFEELDIEAINNCRYVVCENGRVSNYIENLNQIQEVFDIVKPTKGNIFSIVDRKVKNKYNVVIDFEDDCNLSYIENKNYFLDTESKVEDFDINDYDLQDLERSTSPYLYIYDELDRVRIIYNKVLDKNGDFVFYSRIKRYAIYEHTMQGTFLCYELDTIDQAISQLALLGNKRFDNTVSIVTVDRYKPNTVDHYTSPIHRIREGVVYTERYCAIRNSMPSSLLEFYRSSDNQGLFEKSVDKVNEKRNSEDDEVEDEE